MVDYKLSLVHKTLLGHMLAYIVDLLAYNDPHYYSLHSTMNGDFVMPWRPGQPERWISLSLNLNKNKKMITCKLNNNWNKKRIYEIK